MRLQPPQHPGAAPSQRNLSAVKESGHGWGERERERWGGRGETRVEAAVFHRRFQQARAHASLSQVGQADALLRQ